MQSAAVGVKENRSFSVGPEASGVWPRHDLVPLTGTPGAGTLRDAGRRTPPGQGGRRAWPAWITALPGARRPKLNSTTGFK